MYNGEVQIYQENLDRFLAIAQRLKLEGLIGKNKQEEVEEKEELSVVDLQEIDEVKDHNGPEPPPKFKATRIKHTVGKSAVVANVENLSDLDERVTEYLQENLDGSFSCTACGKCSSGQNMTKVKQKQSMKRHIETHLEGLIYTCPICQKTARSYNSLNKHKSKRAIPTHTDPYQPIPTLSNPYKIIPTHTNP